MAGDANHIKEKRKFDEEVIRELKTNKLGDQVENDEDRETDVHFIVVKEYQEAISAILSAAKAFHIEQQITVYKRKYQSFDKWTDKIVYPE
jgi:hypothetical protein